MMMSNNDGLRREVKGFLSDFLYHFKQRDVGQLAEFYLYHFHGVSAKFFSKSQWPSGSKVGKELKELYDDKVFYALYKELHWRHLHWKLSSEVSVFSRSSSWKDYAALFNVLTETASDDVVVPQEWLYDIVNEFVYQFQDFSQWKESQELMEMEKKEMNDNPNMWNVGQVSKTLYQIVQRTGVASMSNNDMQKKHKSMKFVLGYFALMSLCRLQLIAGDYASTKKIVKVLNRMQRFAPKMYAAQVNVQYVQGFVQLMSREYEGSFKTFSRMLQNISRSGILQKQKMSSHERAIKKQFEKSLHLLAVLHVICPQLKLSAEIRDRVLEKIGGQDTFLDASSAKRGFGEAFNIGCPKFTTGHSLSKTTTSHHLAIFKEDMRFRYELPRLQKLLRMYKTLSLKRFVQLDGRRADEGRVVSARQRLVSIKYKTRVKKDEAGAAGAGGDDANAGSTHFWLEGDNLYIQQEQRKKNFSRFFMTHIRKLRGVVDKFEEESKSASLPSSGGSR